jgi:hypothetical protein
VRTAEGLAICAAAACTVAGLRALARSGVVTRSEAVLLNLTGRDREHAVPARHAWHTQVDGRWVPRSNDPAAGGARSSRGVGSEVGKGSPSPGPRPTG